MSTVELEEAVAPTLWQPQPGPQEKAIRASFVPELFFGGARGGGKTSFLMGDFASDVQKYGSVWRGIILRRSFPELDEVVEEGKKVLYPAFPGTEYKVGVHEFRIPHATGTVTLRLRHLESEADADNYMGHQYTYIAFDELCNWPNLGGYNKLKACLRSTAKIDNLRVRATGNPGGVGHQAVKEYFIDAGAPETIIQDDKSAIPRMWIKSLVTDNKILLDADPLYIKRLQSVGDPELVRAWLEGDWSVSLGAYFTNWNSRHCVIPSFEIPEHWPLFGGLDYGESSPTSFGLYTIDYDSHVYRLCEYYQAGATASTHAYEIDRMIAANPHTNGRRPQQIFADPSMWVKRRLSEVVNQSPADVFLQQGLSLTKANNDRVTGWRVINDMLAQRKLHCFDGWNDNLCRTIPSLPRSKSNPEDLDTHTEDHAADELRYAVMHLYQPSRAMPSQNANPFFGSNVLDQLPVAKQRRIA